MDVLQLKPNATRYSVEASGIYPYARTELHSRVCNAILVYCSRKSGLEPSL